MTGPNMATITASLERSLQNCSLNHIQSSSSNNSSSNSTGGGGISRTSSSDLQENQLQHDLTNTSEATLELNSNLSMPYHWEQCLDLKTGEIYYINWKTGMKAKEDPRMTAELSGDQLYSEDDSSYDSEESSTESSPSSSREQYHNINNNSININVNQSNERGHVLVVAGCKSCLMYFMVAKQVEDCPKCCGQLLHFDKSESSSP